MDYRPHIVVVEDEATQRRLLVDYLVRQNFRVSGADGGTALRKLVEREMPALVLLDVGLPGEDGFALARWLREKSARIGIVMVTAASETVDRVVGLETGADDYIAKQGGLVCHCNQRATGEKLLHRQRTRRVYRHFDHHPNTTSHLMAW
jgi:DNA-binding response OmpR family regulator